MKKIKHIVHGEVNFYKTNTKIPKGAVKIMPKDGRYIVADSETTGNHHCIKDDVDIELFEKDGVLYMNNKKEAELFCVDTTRHDTVPVEAGVWEIQRSKEYDYLTQEVRNVRD